MSDGTLDLQLDANAVSPVDEERARVRKEYCRRLAEHLRDPEFRKIEGFPIGTDEAILELSDPPYYTACPNPFIKEWVSKHGKPYDPETDDYHREPFAADVSEGKNDPVYSAHGYHTKVPHKAIMRYILHYTEPDDVVYDGFCGTGMTGVAAQLCGSHEAVKSLGYRVSSTGDVVDANGSIISHIGARKSVLNDLSPAATSIASTYNIPVSTAAFQADAKKILGDIMRECSWMYSTLHEPSSIDIATAVNVLRRLSDATDISSIYSTDSIGLVTGLRSEPQIRIGRIDYTVWSDVFSCPSCGGEIIFWDIAVNHSTGKVLDNFSCPSCNSSMTKDDCDRAWVTQFDNLSGETVKQIKQIPVMIGYSVSTHGKQKRYVKRVDNYDLEILHKIPEPNHFIPSDELPIKEMVHGSRLAPKGLTHIHHFYQKRPAFVCSLIWHKLSSMPEKETKRALRFFFEQILVGMTRLNRHHSYGRVNVNQQLNGVYYLPSVQEETAYHCILDGKLKRLLNVFPLLDTHYENSIITTESAANTILPEDSVDYIFVDPPFGDNIPYSDLNIITESWYRVFTKMTSEATVDSFKGRTIDSYRQVMTDCFRQFYKMLKPGRWMTVEFSNSKNSVWNAISESLTTAGFVIADVRTLDKERGSFRQFTSTTAVKKDLVVSCYKPQVDFRNTFTLLKGKAEGVIEFVREHLSMLPIAPLTSNSEIETVAERTKYVLFDRMVAYHLQNGAHIPMSATDFYLMLDDQFVSRDEMYFLPSQAAHYDAMRARLGVEQLSIFIRDERTAVQWVRTQLLSEQQTLGEITPKFMQETREWEIHEPRPELRDLLKENFIVGEDGKWRVPDPGQEKDLEALRRKGLLKTFETYTRAKGQLKVFRKEAMLEGFKHCWQTKQYGIIVAICERIPAKILHELPEFVQFYDIAKELAPAETQQLEFTWEG